MLLLVQVVQVVLIAVKIMVLTVKTLHLVELWLQSVVVVVEHTTTLVLVQVWQVAQVEDLHTTTLKQLVLSYKEIVDVEQQMVLEAVAELAVWEEPKLLAMLEETVELAVRAVLQEQQLTMLEVVVEEDTPLEPITGEVVDLAEVVVDLLVVRLLLQELLTLAAAVAVEDLVLQVQLEAQESLLFATQ
jgi:hypothetical protein